MTGEVQPLTDGPAGRDRMGGRTAVVVGGGASGPGLSNGRATAVMLAREGAFVWVVDADTSSAEVTVEQIRAEGGSGQVATADVGCPEACLAVSQQIRDRTETVDVLVNNVGVIGDTEHVTSMDIAAWDRLLAVNVGSVLSMVKHLAPAMPPGSAIVNLTSLAATRFTGRMAYSTSKAAVAGLSVALAGQLGADGVRVNAVCPGSVWTPLVSPGLSHEESSRLRAERARTNLLGTEGTAWDTACAVVFLASDDARWITGQSLVVDGGMSCLMP